MTEHILPENTLNGKGHVADSVVPMDLEPYRDVDDSRQAGAGLNDMIAHSVDVVSAEESAAEDAEAAETLRRETTCEDVQDDTDQGDANRLVTRHGHRLAFTGATGWLAFNGKYWEQRASVAANIAAESSQAYLTELSAKVDEAEQELSELDQDDKEGRVAASERIKSLKKLCVWAKQGKNQKRINSTLSRASAHTVVEKPLDGFDAHPYLLTVKNGTIDLENNGALLPFDPGHRVTKYTGVEYDLSARCPMFDAFLESSVPDAEHRAFLLRYLGYCLTGDVQEHKMLLMLGDGRNGKGTLIETIRPLFGGHAGNAKAASFLRHREKAGGDKPTPDVASWKGKRLLTVSELAAGAVLDEEFIKSVSGGDQLTARFLNKDNFDFMPQFKIVWSLNHKPKVSGVDNAIWTRLILMPWSVEFSNPDMTLKKRMVTRELPGILNRLVRGCLEWRRSGLAIPASMIALKDEWRDESNIVKDFIVEAFDIVDPGLKIRMEAEAFRTMFGAWCKRKGIKEELSSRTIGKLGHRVDGFVAWPSNGKTYYLNIAVKQNYVSGGGGGWH